MSLFSRNTSRLRVAIDVGTHSLKTLVFEPTEPPKPPRGVKKMVTRLKPSDNESTVASLLHEIIFSVVKGVEQAPEQIIIGLEPHLITSELTTWTAQFTHNQRRFSHVELQKVFQELFEKNRDQEHTFLAHPVGLLSNGYTIQTHELTGENARNIKEIGFTTVLLRFSDELGPTFEQLRRMFGGLDIQYISLMATYQEAFHKALNIRDALYIDVGGSHTLLMLIREGVLVRFSSFGVGAEDFTHQLAKEQNITVHEAEETGRQYIQGITNKEEQETITRVFNSQSSAWRDRFLDELNQFYTEGPLPEQIILFGGGANVPEIRHILSDTETAKNISHLPRLLVKRIEGSSLFQGNTIQGLLQGPEDVGLAALMFYSLYHEPLF